MEQQTAHRAVLPKVPDDCPCLSKLLSVCSAFPCVSFPLYKLSSTVSMWLYLTTTPLPFILDIIWAQEPIGKKKKWNHEAEWPRLLFYLDYIFESLRPALYLGHLVWVTSRPMNGIVFNSWLYIIINQSLKKKKGSEERGLGMWSA